MHELQPLLSQGLFFFSALVISFVSYVAKMHWKWDGLVVDIIPYINTASLASVLQIARTWLVPRHRVRVNRSERTQENMDRSRAGLGVLCLEHASIHDNILLVHPHGKTVSS